jgi:hypothetical protein
MAWPDREDKILGLHYDDRVGAQAASRAASTFPRTDQNQTAPAASRVHGLFSKALVVPAHRRPVRCVYIVPTE